MLSREQWTKPSLGDFIAWLETKPQGEAYDWFRSSTCACGQYAATIGRKWFDMWCSPDAPLFSHLNALAYTKPHTFGALLARALEVKADGGF